MEKWRNGGAAFPICICGHGFEEHDYSQAEDPFYRKYNDCRACFCKKFVEAKDGKEG